MGRTTRRVIDHAVRLTAVVLAMSITAGVARAQSYPGYPTYPTQPVPSTPYPGYPTVPTLPGGPTTPATAPVLSAYRLPVITLAQPVDGVVLPDDKPVAVIRFAAVEPLDPIDALSLSVTVDGTDRTGLFTLSQGEAWGRLSPIDERLAMGEHELRARICSTRGTCSVAKATVMVVSTTSLLQQMTAANSTASKQTAPSRTSRVLGAVLQAARVLIK